MCLCLLLSWWLRPCSSGALPGIVPAYSAVEHLSPATALVPSAKMTLHLPFLPNPALTSPVSPASVVTALPTYFEMSSSGVKKPSTMTIWFLPSASALLTESTTPFLVSTGGGSGDSTGVSSATACWSAAGGSGGVAAAAASSSSSASSLARDAPCNGNSPVKQQFARVRGRTEVETRGTNGTVSRRSCLIFFSES
jgi:hypothetical protein